MTSKSVYYKIAGVISAIMGIVAVIVGIASIAADKQFEKTAEKTTGVITQIVKTKTHNGTKNSGAKYDYDVYVEYEVDGKTYDEKLDVYYTGMHKGDDIQIMYNPDNPEEIRGGSPLAKLLFPAVFGLVFIGVGVFMFISASKGKV